jgi:DNA-binding MarR family transcriptional regulator
MNYCAHEPSSPAEEELAEIAGELRALWHALMRGAQHSAEIPGLQRQQYWVLGALVARPRRMTELAECAHTSQTSLTGIVDRLEEHGLVVRSRSAEDRRVVEVAATDRGRALMREAHAAMLSQLERLIEPLSPAERTEFVRLLRKITAGHCTEPSAGC